MSRLHRLSQLAATLRHHVRMAWADDAALAAGLDADLVRMEAELSALADAAMVAAMTPRTHCHCGAPLAKPHRDGTPAFTCGHRHCIAISREAKHTIARQQAAQEQSA